MRVAMLTGGGDCPGLNAVMRAVARKGERTYGDELIGFRDGWKGVLEGTVVPMGVVLLNALFAPPLSMRSRSSVIVSPWLLWRIH